MSDKKLIDQRMFVTPIFTAYFVDLKEVNKLSKKYRVVAVFEKGSDLTKIREAIKSAAVSKWGLKDIPKNLKLPLKKPEDEKTPELYPAGSAHCALSTGQTPIVYDRSGKTIVGTDKVYPGCKCRAVVHCYPYDAVGDGQPGVMIGLDTLQFVDDGERLGGSSAAAHNMLAANPLPADSGLGAADDWNFSREPGDEEPPF